MPASAAAVLSSDAPHTAPRIRALPECPVCSDSMIAAEGSALNVDGGVSYLWSCETCGYGFVTRHLMHAQWRN